jgi:hypothetical protein
VRLQVSFGEETALIYPWQMQAAHAYVRGHHGKRHLPTVLRLVADTISNFHREATAAGTAVSFAGFT